MNAATLILGDSFHLQKANPKFNDEEIFKRARLVTAAVLAKIHTIDWTTQLLKNNVLLAAMRVNWYASYYRQKLKVYLLRF